MQTFIDKIKDKPEAKRKKIFMAIMIVAVFLVFSLYVLSIKNSVQGIANSELEQEILPGEFNLPSLKDSVTAGLKDIFSK